jgi:hypothetical protein
MEEVKEIAIILSVHRQEQSIISNIYLLYSPNIISEWCKLCLQWTIAETDPDITENSFKIFSNLMENLDQNTLKDVLMCLFKAIYANEDNLRNLILDYLVQIPFEVRFHYSMIN